MKTLTAIVFREEDAYVARRPEVGTMSQGKTLDEAVQNLREATEFYLEEFSRPALSRPILTTFGAAGAADSQEIVW